MLKKTTTVMAAIATIGLAGCEADEQTFEEGADLDAPPVVEEAPATPIPPQPLPDAAPSDTTLPPIDPDTFGAENL